MARFWKRGEDKSIERLLRANRPEPRHELVSSILGHVKEARPRSTRVTSRRRLGLALALTVAMIALAAVLGGISAATAGVGGIFSVATNAVTPSHTTTTAKTDNDGKGKGDDSDADDQSGKGGNDGKDDDENDDGDHHQYKVGVCHWADHKYVLIFVSPQGAANHLKHHPMDKLAVNGKC